MYNYEFNLIGKINQLERENEALRREQGDFGFFGNSGNSTPRGFEIRKQVKKELTVDEWELVNRFSIDNPEDDIDKVIDIILRLKEKGIFKIPDEYPNYSYSGYGYPYPYGVSLAPNGYNPASNENIDDIKEPENPKEPEKIVNDIFKVVETSEKTNDEYTYTGEVIEIFAPKKYGDKLHDIFKGNDDYADNNIIINVHDTENAILTICKDNIKDMTQLKLKMSEVLGLLFNKEEPEKVEVEIVE